ncbi:MAG: hypothetical protein HYY84_19645 [Deltaproteobacteria bacterium]|nr:hypothetical protein [Deltaproteobacteria bacterium]
MVHRRNACLVLTLTAVFAVNCRCVAPLSPVNRGAGDDGDVSADAAVVNGIEVIPAVILPGARVTLRDPAPIDPTGAAPLYYWDACDGVLDKSVAAFGPRATWVAPETPGLYAVTVNITNTTRENRSRVVALCVVASDAGSCPPASAIGDASVSAAPETHRQDIDCSGSCLSTLTMAVTPPNESLARYRWVTRQGSVTGAGATAVWQLPTVGCCTETSTAAVTACGSGGAAATGFTHVVVFPE